MLLSRYTGAVGAAQECVQYPGRSADDQSIDRDCYRAKQAREQRRYRSHRCQYGEGGPGRTRTPNPPESEAGQGKREAARCRHD